VRVIYQTSSTYLVIFERDTAPETGFLKMLDDDTLGMSDRPSLSEVGEDLFSEDSKSEEEENSLSRVSEEEELSEIEYDTQPKREIQKLI